MSDMLQVLPHASGNPPPAKWPPEWTSDYPLYEEVWAGIGPMPIELIDYDEFDLGTPPTASDWVDMKVFVLMWQSRHAIDGGPDIRDPGSSGY